MKPNKLYFIATLLVTAMVVTSFKKPEPVKGFAVVELFTSEGCSSCPPADAVVARLEKESAGRPIYILAYHVDYWNHLGWKDAFSDAAYSARQRDYAGYLKLQSVYTPQIVVNGKTEFVGAEEGTLHKAISSVLEKEPLAQLSLTSNPSGANGMQIHFMVKNNGAKSVLLIALIQKSAQTKVGGGENGGRTLSHVQIVRALHTVKLTSNQSSSETVNLPAGFNAQGWEIAGLVQSTVSGEIIGAAKASNISNTKNAE
jgi:hypothetical protein